MQRISSALVLCLLAGSAYAQSVNVDLHAGAGQPPAQTYGAVPNQVGSWNQLTAASNPALTNLVGLNGAANGLTAKAVSTNGTGSGSLGTSNFGNLMNDYGFGFTQNGGIDVEVNGLDQGFYRAYVYAALNPSDQSYVDGFGFTNWHTNYIGGTIGAASIGSSSTSGPTTSNTFQANKTHVVLNFVVPAGSPKLTISVSGDLGNGLARCALNGFQLVKITNTRLYVNDNASGANTGLSWTDAFTSLQEALTVAKASAGQITEIWVAAGTYAPGSARTSTFNLVEGVDLYGGFAGTETQLSQRVRGTNTSYLTGNIGNIFATSDNCYQVINAKDISSNTDLDGFTITAGFANGNAPRDAGGGMYAVDSSVHVTHCTFEFNHADRGGGVTIEFADGIIGPIFEDCFFRNNTADVEGGAIRYYGSTGGFLAPTMGIYRSKFIQNSAGNEGGGVCMTGDAGFYNCLFVGNIADDNGGAVFGNGPNVDSFFRSCTIVSNASSTGSGGVRMDGGAKYDTRNTILWGNGGNSNLLTAAKNIFSGNAQSSISYSCVETDAGAMSGVGNIASFPQFDDYNGENNVRGDADDRLWLHPLASPCIDAGNNADTISGGDINKLTRVVDGDLDGTPTTDMGAYEFPRAQCPGDLNNDGFVDDNDFVIFAGSYNLLLCSDPAMPVGCPADLDFNGLVDDQDFVIFANAYNTLLCP
ncbi:MAG TPA: hypothetical protein VF777_15750 [Phycisphaerales bacterium]